MRKFSVVNTASLVRLLAIVIALLHLYFNTFSTLSGFAVSVIHFVTLGSLLLLLKQDSPPFVRVINLSLMLLLIASSSYMLVTNDALFLERGANLNNADRIMGVIAVLIALELARRASGLVIPALSLIGLAYAIGLGSWIPGVFTFPGLSFDTVLFRAFFSDSGLFGTISRISWSYVFAFLLLGSFLLKSGCGEFIIKLSMALASKVIGGTGFVAVISSALMGSISGSSVANTASTGVVTIPLMKRTGFRPYYAAGIEAAASTGGQLMPPVMGAGAFIMASYTQIPYTTIILYSILPAVLYYLSVLYYVRIEALKQGVHLLDTQQEKHYQPVLQVLRDGWYYIIPFVVLIGLLVYGFTPTWAAGIGTISVVVSSWLGKHPMRCNQVADALEYSSRSMATLAMLLVCIGLPVMVINTTGIGNTFSLMLSSWSGGSLVVAIAFVALASLIVGMGLPVTASYIVVASLCAPTIYTLMIDSHLIEIFTTSGISDDLVAVLGLFSKGEIVANQPLTIATANQLLADIPLDMRNLVQQQLFDANFLVLVLLSAHLIIFWLSQDSNVTPPVCLVAFTAATIAGTKPMRTGFYAWKLAKGLYLIPLLMAYDYLIIGDYQQMLASFAYAAFGIYLLVAAVEGYMEHRLSLIERVLCLTLAAMLLYPHHIVWINLAGLLSCVALLVYSVRYTTKMTKS